MMKIFTFESRALTHEITTNGFTYTSISLINIFLLIFWKSNIKRDIEIINKYLVNYLINTFHITFKFLESRPQKHIFPGVPTSEDSCSLHGGGLSTPQNVTLDDPDVHHIKMKLEMLHELIYILLELSRLLDKRNLENHT